MSKTYRTTGSGAQQTLHEIEDEKIPVYDTQSDAEADLANLAEGQIVATKDAGTDEQTLIEYVDGRLETTTTEITMDVFKTGSKAQLYKSGNNVQFRYYAEGNSTFNPIAENTWVTIGTIPEGLRPKSRIEAGMQGGLGGTLGLYAIDTTGAVQVFHYPNTGWAAVFAIQCDYNVDGTNSHGMTVNTLKDAKDYTDEKIYEKIAGTIRVTDCDTMDVPGTYNYDPSTANTPDNFYGVLVVYGSSPDKTPSTNRRWIMQVATNTRGEVYRRQRNQPQTGGTWTAWTGDVLHKDIVVPTPSTPPSNNVYGCVLYQLQNVDWTFLTSQPAGATATGNFELSGYYWGNYVATNHIDGTRTVTGTIDWNAVSHTFSAFYDSSVSAWKINVDGEWLLYNANGLTLTVTGQSRTFRFICERVPFNVVGEQLQTYGLYGRQALGRVGMEMNTALTYQDTDLITLTNNSYAWPAGSIYWWSNPTFQQANTSASTWPMYAQNDNHFYKIELWGSAWDQCYISGGFEFTL